jgi:hypothetical protein
MSVESISAALNLSDDRLTPTDRLLLVGIANHDGDGGAWPSMATLARYCGIEIRSVRKRLAFIEELGYVRREVGAGGTARTPDHSRPTLYHLNLRAPVPQDTPGPTGPPPPVAQAPSPPVPQALPPRSSRTPEPSCEPSVEPSSGRDAPSAPFWTEERGRQFEEFWVMYGRVGPRLKARECWMRAVKAGADPDAILNGLEAWVSYWKTPNAASVKWPQGWLSERRWEDAPPVLLSVVQNRTVSKGRAALDKYRQNGGQR